MKFKFSLKWLFVLTTAASVLMAIAMWLQIFSRDWRILAAFGFYFLIYLTVAGVFFGPRYLREFKEFRASRRHQKATHARLESESQMLLANLKSEQADTAGNADDEPES